MTIIAFTDNKIYADRSATTSVVSRTIDRKIIRLGTSIIVGCAGLALTEAELSCLTPLIPQIIAVRTPHDAYDLLDEVSDIYSKSKLESTLLLITPHRAIILTINRFRKEINLWTRAEMGKMPMAIGSGALQFIHNLELLKDVEKAVIAATLADPHCGRDIYCIDIAELGKGEVDPPYTPKPKPRRERNPDRPPMMGNHIIIRPPMPFAI